MKFKKPLLIRLCCGVGVLVILMMVHRAHAQYSLQLGVVLEDMSKANLERIKTLSQAYNQKFGIDFRVVIQKRQDLLIKLYQNESVDFILTGLPQVLALEKNEVPYKVLLRSYRTKKSDPFVVFMSQHKSRESPLLTFPAEHYLAGRSHIVLSEETAKQQFFFPKMSSKAEQLVVKDIEYSTTFFKSHFTTLDNPILVDIKSFSYEAFGKIRSFREKEKLEKKCNCVVIKMSPPIPQRLVLVNPKFYEKRPLQTYQLMEFFLHISDDPKHRARLLTLFDLDGFVTATNNVISPFEYLYSQFKFAKLAAWDLKSF
jgi:ABC-type phosphate/phosphonate transport system substrate-binding protein